MRVRWVGHGVRAAVRGALPRRALRQESSLSSSAPAIPAPRPSSAPSLAHARPSASRPSPSPEQQRLQRLIRTAVTRSDYEGVLELWRESRDRRVELDAQDRHFVLTACTLVPTGSPAFRHVRDASKDAYAAMVARRAVPLEVFHKMVAVARRLEDPAMALQLYRDYGRTSAARTYKSMGRERVTYTVLETVALFVSSRSASEARSVTEAIHMSLCEVFADACRLMAVGAPSLGEGVFATTALAFSQLGLTNQLMQTLEEMTGADVEPSLALCERLLSQALFRSDTTVLKVLLGWYLNDFFRALDAGQTDRLMHIAAYRGDQAVARLGLKMLAQAGRAPSLLHYVCWTRACLNAQDLNGALEALLEAQAQGLSLLDSAHGHALQTLLGDCFKLDTVSLDSMYFALADLRSGGYAVPPAALNGVVLAAGKLSQLDRAFGTFREYESLFGVRPDLHAHNALLAAVLASKFPQVEAMLSIFEDMEGAGLEPCEASYSLLLAAMAETGDMTSYDEVAAYMRKQGRGPSPRALRRVCLRLARDGQQGRLDEALALMRELTDEPEPPRFLRRRLDLLLARVSGGGDEDGSADHK